MISPLPSTMVPSLGIGELPSSFASRIGHLLGRSARDFCLDVGLKFQAIVDGQPGAINALAVVGRGDPDALTRFACQRINARSFTIRGHSLDGSALYRSRVRVCCACIAADMNNGAGPECVRAFQRAIWLVRDIQTCPLHQQALMTVTQGNGTAALHDFAAVVPDLVRNPGQPRSRVPTSFETYVISRFHDTSPPVGNWLDQFTIQGVGKICLVFGAMEAFGAKVNLTSISDGDRLDCQQKGFQIASKGEAEIRQLLNDLHKRRSVNQRSVGPMSHFSLLYAWLAHETKSPQYQPLRRIVAEYCFDNFPGRSQFLGFEQSSPKVHSIHSAALEYGVSPHMLHSLLVLSGVAHPKTKEMSFDHVLFDAALAHPIIERYQNSLPTTKATEYLNIQRPLSDELLGGKYLPQLVRAQPGWPIYPVFERSMLDQFLQKLRVDALPLNESNTGMFSIVEASKRACCKAMEIIDLLISRQLQTVRISDNDQGIQALRVDLGEVRSHVRLTDHGGLSLREVEDELGTSTAVVKALITLGILQSRTAINPVNRCPQTVVDRESLADFRSEYISLVCLAEEREIPFRRLKKRLSDVPTAFDRNLIGATFFRRSSLPD